MRNFFLLRRPSYARRKLAVYMLLVLTLSCGDAAILTGSPGTRAAVAADPPPVQHADYAAHIRAEPGILGYWRLSETGGCTAVDDVGGRDGAYFGGVRLGNGTTAPLFNGSDTYVRVNALPTNTGALSLEGWVHTTDRPSHTMGLLGYRVSGYSQFTLDQPSGENSLHARFVNGSGGAIDLSASLPPDVRHYIALTYDGLHTFSIAIDGAVVSSRTDASGVLGDTSDAFFIGATDEGKNFFAGALDNIAVYRVALSPAVMQSHFSLGTGGSSPTATPAATSTPVDPTRTFYVSPDGSDMDPGTQAAPWQTLNKAMATLTAGQTAIFADGTYTVTRQANTGHAGAAGAPITIKSQNKWGAKIVFQEMQSVWGKLHIIDPYWTVQDFEITQDAKGTDTNDVLLFADLNNGWDSSNLVVQGNKLHNAYEKCLKFAKSDHTIVDGNVCYDVTHDGIDFVNSNDVTVSNNEIYHVGRTAMFFKEGSRSVRVFNNYYHEDGNYQSGYPDLPNGIQLGDQGTVDVTYDPYGYEGYNQVAFNNIVVSNPPGHIGYGLAFFGATDSAFLNNVVSGARTGVMARESPDVQYGWPQNPKTNNARVLNNIIVNSVWTATDYRRNSMTGSFISDYNLYANASSPTDEPHSILADPRFINPMNDWRLQNCSPAIGRGITVSFTDYAGRAVDVAFTRAGVRREGVWNIGAY